ncbi:MAG: tail fiber assembly protein [Plesiomonas shigelloides]
MPLIAPQGWDEMNKTKNTFNFSDVDRTITVYGYLADTGEYIGKSDCFIPATTGLPAYCTHISPPVAEPGKTVIFNDQRGEWEQVDNHRGQTVYSVITRQPQTVTELGALPADVTLLVPSSDFDCWSGQAWVKDDVAERDYQRQQGMMIKRQKMIDATQRIDVLTDKVNLGMSTNPEETRALIDAWRLYRAQLDETDPASVQEIWPSAPEALTY